MKVTLGSQYEFDACEEPQVICYDIGYQQVVNPFTVAYTVVLENLIKKLGEVQLGPTSRLSVEFFLHNKGECYTGVSDDRIYLAVGHLIVEDTGEEQCLCHT